MQTSYTTGLCRYAYQHPAKRSRTRCWWHAVHSQEFKTLILRIKLDQRVSNDAGKATCLTVIIRSILRFTSSSSHLSARQTNGQKHECSFSSPFNMPECQTHNIRQYNTACNLVPEMLLSCLGLQLIWQSSMQCCVSKIMQRRRHCTK